MHLPNALPQSSVGKRKCRAENKESQRRQTLVVWTVYAKLGNHFPAEEVVRIGDRDYASRIRFMQADENPSAWRSGIWITGQCFKPDGKHVRFHFEVD